MRTTLNVSDHLLVAAKQLAASRRTTLTKVVEESLRAYLAEARATAADPTLGPLPINRQSIPRATVDLDDSSALMELE